MPNKQNVSVLSFRHAALCVSLALAACASLDSRPPEERVRQRVAERWQAMAAGDMSRAYSYTPPSFRELVSFDVYRQRFGIGGSWVGGEAVSVNCADTAKCTARVRVDFKPLLVKGFDDKISTHTDETWLLEGGQWWLFQTIDGK
ncbi:MAG: hypothetical protein ACOYNZ_12520 [Rhodoferax sp.]